jgi:outer membrane receptor for ferrienterochelin and colicins
MRKIIVLVFMMLSSWSIYAQNTLKALVKSHENEPIPGAAVQLDGTTIGTITNENGLAEINGIPNGTHSFTISFLGHEEMKITLSFPREEKIVTITLEEIGEELEEVIVTSTRVSRSIDNIPTRVEAVSLEEIDEKSNMRPSNVAMLLHESTGIQVQQTSYTSATQTIRIQGLDGKYTQLLKDGFPNYSGFSSGLSILDIPPLDLRQVEIIKGSASTLYGGGAIAGVVNFITKAPKDKREINVIMNQTSALGSDAGIFLSGRNEKIGFTMLGTYHYQKEYDVDDDDFTELPRQHEFTLFPKLFLYPNEATTVIIGNSFTSSDRTGGDVHTIRGDNNSLHPYFEKNESYRNNTYLSFDRKLSETKRLLLRQSANYFNRDLSKPDYSFSGNQIITYTDASFINQTGKHTYVLGLNYVHDQFNEGKNGLDRNQTLNTISVYAQDNWDVTQKFLLEGGLRVDHNFTYGTFVLPRFSVLYKMNEKFTSRLGGGIGYKAPTLFVEETESLFFENVLPLDKNLDAEKSVGVNFDLNFTHDFTDQFSFSINQLFFFTQINDPLVLNQDVTDYFFTNENKPIQTKGFETNMRFIFDPLKFFIGYTWVDAKATYKSGEQFISLTPPSRLNLILLLEKHKNYKLGLEGYYTDHQRLDDGTRTPSWWEFGFFAEKTFGPVSLYINFENFTDTRQNRFENVVKPPHETPAFAQVYTHTEGFIINGGVKLKLE